MKRFHQPETLNKRTHRNHLLAAGLALTVAVVVPLGALSGCGDFGYSPEVRVTIPQTDEIRCKTLEVVNKEDQVVVRINTDDDGNGLLTVFAADGETILATLPMK